jgi:hypothetical protein
MHVLLVLSFRWHPRACAALALFAQQELTKPLHALLLKTESVLLVQLAQNAQGALLLRHVF